MKQIGKCMVVLLALVCLTSTARVRPSDEIIRLLTERMAQEEIHPDSSISNIRRIEAYRKALTDKGQRAVCAAVMGRIYADGSSTAQAYEYTMPADTDSIQEWSTMDWYRMSARRYKEALADPSVLSQVDSKKWTPLVIRGNREKVYGRDMLNVVWRSMRESIPVNLRSQLGVPTYADIIGFYASVHNRQAALQLTLDSLDEYGTATMEGLEGLLHEYQDLDLCADVYLRMARLYDTPREKKRDLLHEGINKYPKYKHRAELQNELTLMSAPMFDCQIRDVVYPGKQYKLVVRSRNLTSVTLDGMPLAVDFGAKDRETDSTYVDTVLWTAPVAPGKYTLTFRPQTSARLTEKLQPMKQELLVSRLQVIYISVPSDNICLRVADAQTGESVVGATVILYDSRVEGDSVELCRHVTDHMGRVLLLNPQSKGGSSYLYRNVRIRVETENEKHLPARTIYNNVYFQTDDATDIRQQVHTDRAVYRPGQTVHVGMVTYQQRGWDAQVLTGRRYTVRLIDANYREVDKLEAETDDMGVLSCQFTLPTDRKNGLWRVSIDNGSSTSFRVEEYRRPTFDVKIDDLPEKFVPTTVIPITGVATAYDGTPVRNARVTGSYVNRMMWGVMGRKVAPAETIRLDTIYTDSQGRFAYELPCRGDDMTGRMLSVMMDVLNQTGETQHAEKTISFPSNVQPTSAPRDSSLWLTTECDTFAVGRPAVVTLTTKLHNAWVHCMMMSMRDVVSDTILHLDCDTYQWQVEYKEEYGQGVSIKVEVLQDERFQTRDLSIHLQQPDMKLRYHWDSFRDHLMPGQKEEWQLTFLNPDGTPARASLLATMYDAALDKIAEHTWFDGLTLKNRIPYASFFNLGRRDEHVSAYFDVRLKSVGEWTYTNFNPAYFCSPYYSTVVRPMVYMSRPMLMAKNDATTKRELYGSIAGLRDTDMAEVVEVNDDVQEIVEEKKFEGVTLRENFNETAFFMPALRTDEAGHLSLAFTLPECVTTWRLRGFAHTANMCSAQMDEEIVANKDLMATLFLPRFVRHGDEVMLTARINNMTSLPQKGSARMQILRAADERVMETWMVKVNLQANEDSIFSFAYRANEADGDVIVRWVAETDRCSDGEQRLIPVLSNKERVEVTRALWLSGSGVTNVDLSSIFPDSCDNRLLTIEYTTHPEELVRQCLPALAVAKHNDVFSISAAYYAGMLAKYLGIEIADSTDIYATRLQSLQKADGSFSWYPGMMSSMYCTRQVAFLLTRLQTMTGSPNLSVVLNGAVKSLMVESAKLIDMWKEKNIEAEVLPTYLLRNLYVLVNNKQLLQKSDLRYVQYMMDLLKKTKYELDNEEMALAAVILHADGEPEKAKRYLSQVTRRLVNNNGKGTYIEYRKGSFTSIDRKQEVHVQIMEALETVMPDSTRLLAGMRQWLLQQKRTQQWNTPINTANAVFAILSGDRMENADGARDVLTLKRTATKTPINFVAQDDALGYLCDSLAIDSRHLPETLRIHKMSKGESWGAVFATFDQPIQDIEAASTGLRIRVDYPSEVVKGERARVKYVITADMDYEYVTLVVPHVSAMEAVSQVSSYRYMNGLGYYQEMHDATTEYHFCSVPRGTYVIEQDFYVERTGVFNTGIANIRCTLAEEFQSHYNNNLLRIR